MGSFWGHIGIDIVPRLPGTRNQSRSPRSPGAQDLALSRNQNPEQEHPVEKILSDRYGPGGKQYLVQWVGYDERTWEPLSHLAGANRAVQDYEEGQSDDHTPGLCFFWSCQTFGQTTKYCHNYSHIPQKSHNVLAMPKTQKTCIVGTTPPMKSNPMACGLGWGHGHIVQWQCFACCMTCGMPMGACCGSHFGPNGGGQTSKFQR